MREDGYHEVKTLMVPITVFDRMLVSVEKGDFFELEADAPIPKDNTLRRAYEVFRGASGLNFGLRIRLEKTIPPGSGLGGGSSDGAYLLRFLNRHFGNPFSLDDLAKLSTSIGMDVPFFIYGRPAFMVGRGDKLGFFVDLPDLKFLVVWPSIVAETGKVYREFDEMKPSGALPLEVKRRFKDAEELSSFLRNDLEAPFLSLFPEVAKVKEILLASGALAVSMTGSGSSFFSIYGEDASIPEDTVKKLEGFGCKVFRTSFLRSI